MLVKFCNNNNNLWDYDPQILADVILNVMLEIAILQWRSVDKDPLALHFLHVWDCTGNLFSGLHKNITSVQAFDEIQKAVYSLSPFKFNDIIEALNLEFKQKGLSDDQANKEVNKKLNSIIQVYANKLVEKARGGQSVQIKR